MKKFIKKILREQEVVKGHSGWWYDHDKQKHIMKDNTMPTSSFFKAVRYMVENFSYEGLKDVMNSDSYERWEEIHTFLKLFGIGQNDVSTDSADGLPAKILWASLDNYDALKNGDIESFDQLDLRPLKTYKLRCSEYAQENVSYHWDVEVNAYEEGDAEMEVSENEDGAYSWWEWDSPKYNFDKDHGDYDSEGIEIEKIQEVAFVPVKPLTEVESPEENDLIDKLRKIMKQWKKEDKENEWYDKIENALKELHIPLKD